MRAKERPQKEEQRNGEIYRERERERGECGEQRIDVSLVFIYAILCFCLRILLCKTDTPKRSLRYKKQRERGGRECR